MATGDKERVEEILEQAAGLQQTERLEFIRRACGDDETLVEEIVRLLDADSESSLQDFLDQGLPQLMESAARHAVEMRDDEVQRLRREEHEERLRWEKKFVGDEVGGLGRYEIVVLRRFGKMASLFFGRDRKIGKDVVIKIPRMSAYIKGDEDDAELANAKANIRNNFRREFDALVKLTRCPYVVHVLDYGDLPDGRPFVVQEFIEGRNALELLDLSRDELGRIVGLAFRQMANIIRETGYGLESAHNLDILHRDVKAENIMTDGVLTRLIDFNAADVKLPLSPMSTVFKDQMWGTLGYVSPEQLTNMMETDTARGPIQLTRASDVYSLAVTAYQLLTGRMPFSTNVKELIEQQAACAFTPASELRLGVSKEIDRLLRKALAHTPSERPQSAMEFGEAFASALERTATARTEPMHLHERFKLKTPLSQLFTLRSAVVALALVLLLVAGSVMWRVLNKQKSATPSAAASTTPLPPPSTANSSPPQTTRLPERTFSYWLELTRAADSRTVDDAANTAARPGVFNSHDTFVLNFASTDGGWVYLLSEGKNYRGRTTFYYVGRGVTTERHDDIDTQLSFGPLVSDNNDASEKLWLVFSSERLQFLEAYRAPGELPTDKTETISSFLAQHRSFDVSVHNFSQWTHVKGSSNVIAYTIELPRQVSGTE